jgi:hypothetical protein
MKTNRIALLFALLVEALLAGLAGAQLSRLPSFASSAAVPLQSVPRETVRLDLATVAEVVANRRSGLGGPYRFAERVDVTLRATEQGRWERLEDGSRLWRLRLHSPGALSLSLHLSRFSLPEGAALWLYDPQGDLIQGPLGATHGRPWGQLWSPLVWGSDLVLELALPAGAPAPELEIGGVYHGFRSPVPKGHGSCNIDIACPEGDAWREQIRAGVLLIIDGNTACSGQLVNNTANDDRPLLLTASHCYAPEVFEPPVLSLVPTTVAYFNVDAPMCGQRDGGSFGQWITGAFHLASDHASDFLLAELVASPPASFDAYLAGWDAGGAAADSVVTVHHPQGHVKSISFSDDRLTTASDIIPDGTHWEVDNWEQGTTEPGSSGSCIYDQASGQCVGVLSGGFAACGNQEPDFYGKLSAAWEGDETVETRLRDWLDPVGSGQMRLGGKEPQGGAACVETATSLCLNGGRFRVEVLWQTSDGSGLAQVVQNVSSLDSGLFYFFDRDNWEVLIKVIDACADFDRYWVFAAATTDVEYTIRVTDTQQDRQRSYPHAAGTPAPAITDTNAFATCP